METSFPQSKLCKHEVELRSPFNKGKCFAKQNNRNWNRRTAVFTLQFPVFAQNKIPEEIKYCTKLKHRGMPLGLICATRGFQLPWNFFFFFHERKEFCVPTLHIENQNPLARKISLFYFLRTENVWQQISKLWAAHKIKIIFLSIVESSCSPANRYQMQNYCNWVFKNPLSGR